MLISLSRTALIAALLVLGWQASAEVKIWQAAGGRWDEPSHWLGGAPVAGDDVVITNVGAEVLVTAATPALNSLTLTRRLVCSNWTTRVEARAVVIAAGGVITLPPAFRETGMSNRVWIVCSNLTVAAGGKIDVSGKGYAGGSGATGSNGAGLGGGYGGTLGRGGGGGYGGRGGWGVYATEIWSLRGGGAYGQANAPVNPGSGGGALKYSTAGGGAGGGAVRIEAAGTVVVDGLIVADGADALRYSGGGSGGGIWITCRRFGGTGGRIGANGGSRGDEGGGGGGGRIAVDYTSLVDTPTVRFETREAPCTLPVGHIAARWPTHWLSGHGTLWFPDRQVLSATLDRFHGTLLLADAAGWPDDSLTVSNGTVELPGGLFEINGPLIVGRHGVLVLTPDRPVRIGGETLIDGGRLVLSGFTQMVCQAGLTVTNGGVFLACAAPTNGVLPLGASVDVAGEIRVADASWIIPECQGTNGGPVRFRCANASIAAGGGFDTVGRGFLGGDMVAGQKGLGPGGGTGGAIGYYGSGGGYGGQGGWSWYELNGWGKAGGQAYGSICAPVMPGSGGGSFNGYAAGHGGGTVWIEADGSIILDGAIMADAGMPLSYTGGGAGGGVFLAARDFRGSIGSRISACGTPGGERAGAGGGGRIAVALGLGQEALQALVGGVLPPGLYSYLRHGSFTGAIDVTAGYSPYDFSGEEWRAPQDGTWRFLTTNTTFHVLGAPDDYGHPAPDPYGGCPYYAAGTWITNRVVTPDDEAAGTRHACTGYTLDDATGGRLDAAVATQAVFRLDATRVLTWHWTNEYHLAVLDGPYGGVSTGLSGWYTNDTVVPAITATPDSGYIFDRWVGDFPDGGETSNPLTVTMDRPRTLTPVFASATGLDKVWTGGTGVWEDPGNWAPPGVPGLYDRVSITAGVAVVNLPRQTAAVTVGAGGTLLFTNWVASLTARDVTVASGGLVTLPPAFATGAMSNRVWIICTNLTVAAGGRIDADGKGYLGGYNGQPGHGPGGGEGNHHGGGGGHGGAGGCGTNLRGGPAYGDHEEPLYPGSGGGAHPDTRSRGGAGGGAIRIEALGEVIVDGMITASGTGATYYSGGGSGGSVAIDCRRFGGRGVVTANGGLCANTGGGGGGGRIAVKYGELAGTPGVRFEARGEESGWPAWSSRFRWTQYRWASQPGTLHFPDTSQLGTVVTNLQGELHVPAFSSWAPPSLAVSNSLLRFPAGFDLRVGGDLIVGAGSAIELAPGSFLSVQGDVQLDGGQLVMNGFTQATFRAGLELANGGRFYAYSTPTNGTAAHGASVDVAGDIRVGAGSWILPDVHGTNGGPVRFRCENAFIAADGGFDADGRGFLGSYFIDRRQGYGPGAGAVDNCGSGAGYGGRGGDAWEVSRWGAAGGMSYGMATGTVWPGSGGGSQANYQDGGHGGGLIWIEAAGAVRSDGILRADGGVPGLYAGGGSGGGIMVIAARFSGGPTASLSVCGSDGGSPPRGGPGGGGRIVVAAGLTPGERVRLLADDPRNLRIVDLQQSFAGQIRVDPGLLGPDYTTAPERAPTAGSAVFLRSAGGSLILLR